MQTFKSIQIYRGKVENNNSPHQDGTVQVRIPGIHPGVEGGQFEEVKTEDLPWIEVINGGFLSNRVGTSAVPQIGAWVYVLVTDNLDEMMVIGQMKSGPDDINQFSKGDGYQDLPSFGFSSTDESVGNFEDGAGGGYGGIDVQGQSNGPMGFVSQHFESGKRGVGTISTGKGDQGGVSYGTFQLASKTGTMKQFINSPEGRLYKPQFGNLYPGTSGFNAVYSGIASQDGQNFHMQQFKYIKRTHFDSVERYAKGRGFNTNSRRVQEQLFSQSVQHGYNGNKTIIDNVVNSRFTDGTTDEDIRSLYTQRGNYASKFANYAATRGRYSREVLMVLGIPADQPAWVDGRSMRLMNAVNSEEEEKDDDTTEVVIVEPEELDSKTEYPHSHSLQTESGHLFLADDTLDNERVKLQHKTGAYFEIRPSGNFVLRTPSTADNTIIIEGGLKEYIEGEVHNYIGGMFKAVYNGQVDTTHNATITSLVKGQVQSTFKSTITSLIQDQVKLEIQSTLNMDVEGDITIKTNGNVNVESSGNAVVKSGGSVSVTASGSVNVKGQTVNLN